MQAHEDAFVTSYEEIIDYCLLNNKFDNLSKNFEEIVIDFPFPVGRCDLVRTDETDTILYAKRRNREIYSKFVLNRKSTIVNSCVIILKQSYTNPNEYFLITMFPGSIAIKEPSDRNIKTIEELQQIINYWDKHALVFEGSTIDQNTIRKRCPYNTAW